MFAWSILKNKREYERAVAEIERLMDVAAPTKETSRQLELGAHLVSDYEERNFPMPLPTPVEAIRFRMEQQGLSRKDLEPLLGGPSKVSEVLNGKRPLSMAMVRAVHDALGISWDVLMQRPGRRRFPFLRAAAAL